MRQSSSRMSVPSHPPAACAGDSLAGPRLTVPLLLRIDHWRDCLWQQVYRGDAGATRPSGPALEIGYKARYTSPALYSSHPDIVAAQRLA
jgi:hypothetical protein